MIRLVSSTITIFSEDIELEAFVAHYQYHQLKYVLLLPYCHGDAENCQIDFLKYLSLWKGSSGTNFLH